MWDVLLNAGFQRSSTNSMALGQEFAQATGFTLPDTFVEFLSYHPPEAFELAFNYVNQSDGETWEGQFAEVLFSPPPTIAQLQQAVVRPDSGGVFLTFGASSGGADYLYLQLDQPGMPVTIVDDVTLKPARISDTFEQFLDRLYPID
jgi:hypothetical protein